MVANGSEGERKAVFHRHHRFPRGTSSSAQSGACHKSEPTLYFLQGSRNLDLRPLLKSGYRLGVLRYF
eukprot:scaffold15224_cov181-Amphora_coffeaeformis.AAC.3